MNRRHATATHPALQPLRTRPATPWSDASAVWLAAGCCGTSEAVKAVARPRDRMGRQVWLTPCRASRAYERR